ncbi:MAG TPA: Qat anti-phage system TatD family nuclease QatD [Luteimonas sp.]|nr:Qat anti-phage system TatD family nuclease QatD [Luteimonas sp.]
MTTMYSHVDAHCHVDLLRDWQDAVNRLESRAQFTLAVTTTPKAWRVEQEFARHCRYVRIGVGLHPQVLHERMAELPLLERAIGDSRFVGEIGLDGSPMYKNGFLDQVKALRRIFSVCAEVKGRVLSLHSVRAVAPLLDLLEETNVHEGNAIIFHWFTGSGAELERALSRGAMISVNADMLKTSKGKAHARMAGPERTLTESDSPFTRSHPLVSGLPSVEPAIDALAECWDLSASAVMHGIERLARRHW